MIDAWFNESEMIASSVVEQRFEHATVGVEARRERDRIVGADELGDLVFQRAMEVERAADETHRRHTVPVGLHRLVGGRDERLVVREAEVVVGAEVQHLGTVSDRDRAALSGHDLPLGLPQAIVADPRQRHVDLLVEPCSTHRPNVPNPCGPLDASQRRRRSFRGRAR